MQCYLNLKVKKEFGGFRTVPKAKIESYLLNMPQVENGVPYIVAVLPNAETAPTRPGELFIRIDRYLDGATQCKDDFACALEVLSSSFDMLRLLTDEALSAVILSLLPKDFKHGSDLVSGLGRTIHEYNTQEDLIKRVEQLKIQNSGFDIFIELNEYTDFFREVAASGTPKNCKILFPFNLGNSHWVSVEIKIHKKPDHQYDCSVYLYDPKYPRSEMDDPSAQLGGSNFGLVKSALERRIKACDAQANVAVVNALNPYSNPRQSSGNNIDCGIYAVCDIAARIAEQPLGENPLSSPDKLRQEMIACMRQGTKDAARADKPLEAVALQKLVDVNEARLKLYSRSVSGGSLVFKW